MNTDVERKRLSLWQVHAPLRTKPQTPNSIVTLLGLFAGQLQKQDHVRLTRSARARAIECLLPNLAFLCLQCAS